MVATTPLQVESCSSRAKSRTQNRSQVRAKNQQQRSKLANSFSQGNLAGIRSLGLVDMGAIFNRAKSTLQADLRHGRVPAPDFYIGRSPRWLPATVENFLMSKVEVAK